MFVGLGNVLYTNPHSVIFVPPSSVTLPVRLNDIKSVVVALVVSTIGIENGKVVSDFDLVVYEAILVVKTYRI
jgi:hypothetical protein